MDVEARIMVKNIESLTRKDSAGDISEIEIGIFKDQDYDQIRKKDKLSCSERRDMATELITTVVPLDGTWSDNFTKGMKGQFSTTITTQVRPRIYYFEIIDCDKKVSDSFRTGVPRIVTDIHITASDKQYEYSFESIGLLEL